jgi:hypothetical protein
MDDARTVFLVRVLHNSRPSGRVESEDKHRQLGDGININADEGRSIL